MHGLHVVISAVGFLEPIPSGACPESPPHPPHRRCRPTLLIMNQRDLLNRELGHKPKKTIGKNKPKGIKPGW
eukprot:SAG22_NODE_8281_length_667_cov_4.903169_2_plen_71_part_01